MQRQPPTSLSHRETNVLLFQYHNQFIGTTHHGIIGSRKLGARFPGNNFSLLRNLFCASFPLQYHRFDSVKPGTDPYKTIRELPNVVDAFKSVVDEATKHFHDKNAFVLPFGVMSTLLPDKPRADSIDRLRLTQPNGSLCKLSAQQKSGL